MFNSSQKPAKASVQFWLLATFLLVVFVTGGSSRSDVQSLAILYPLSILFCGGALVTLQIHNIRENKLLFIGIGLIFSTALLLPEIVWPAPAIPPTTTDVRAILDSIGSITADQHLRFAPNNGWETASIASPLAVLLLGAQLKRIDVNRLLPVVIALGSVSGFFGLLQIFGDANGPLYLYRITNTGSAVGLFANRNHSAALLSCLFPMLAVYASTRGSMTIEQRFRQIGCVAVGIVILPLILVTGSRSGLLTGVIGLAGAAALYVWSHTANEKYSPKSKIIISKNVVIASILVSVIGFLTYFFARAEAIERLFLDDISNSNRRADFVDVAIDLFWKHFPVGTGSESFATVYQMAEPLRLLNPTRLNRAHNDWIEFAVTYGALGLFILAAFVSYFILRAFFLFKPRNATKLSVQVSRMAAIAIGIIALASLSDYPLRTPLMASVFSILVLWFMEAGKSLNGDCFEPATGTIKKNATLPTINHSTGW